MKVFRQIIPLLVVTAISLCLGCNNNNSCDPNMICDTVQPTTAPIVVLVSNNDENQDVPLSIYVGNADDSVLYFRDTVTQNPRYDVPINTRYSVVAKYRQGANTVYAVDGGKTKLVTTPNCNEYCYTTNELRLNLKLLK